MATTDESMFWELIEELQLADPRVEEGTRPELSAGRRGVAHP